MEKEKTLKQFLLDINIDITNVEQFMKEYAELYQVIDDKEHLYNDIIKDNWTQVSQYTSLINTYQKIYAKNLRKCQKNREAAHELTEQCLKSYFTHSIDILKNKDNPKRRDVVRSSFGFDDHLCDLIEKNIE